MLREIKNNLNQHIVIGLVLMAILLIFCLVAPFWVDYDIATTDAVNRLQAPSLTHLMGTDDLGRDVAARTLYGIRTSLCIGILVTVVSTVVGLIIGLASALYPWASRILMGVVDGVMTFPAVILAIALAGILGSGFKNIVIALAIAYFPMIARVTKAAAQDVLTQEYTEAAKVLGKSDFYLVIHYILPNIIGQVIVQATFTFAMAILNEAILSYLGVGIKAPASSLGSMVSDGRSLITLAPWIVMFPSLFISWIVLAMNMLGDGLQTKFKR